MKSQQFGDILEISATLAPSPTSRDLVALAELFHIAGSRTVKTALGQLDRYFRATDQGLRVPTGLPEFIGKLQQILEVSGAKAGALDCSVARSFLEGWTAPHCDRLDLASASLAFSKATRPPKGRGRAFDSMAARNFADRLTSSMDDRMAFSRLLHELSGAKATTLEDLTDVARRFLGNDRVFRTKAEAVKAIELRRKQVETQESRHRALSKIGV